MRPLFIILLVSGCSFDFPEMEDSGAYDGGVMADAHFDEDGDIDSGADDAGIASDAGDNDAGADAGSDASSGCPEVSMGAVNLSIQAPTRLATPVFATNIRTSDLDTRVLIDGDTTILSDGEVWESSCAVTDEGYVSHFTHLELSTLTDDPYLFFGFEDATLTVNTIGDSGSLVGYLSIDSTRGVMIGPAHSRADFCSFIAGEELSIPCDITNIGFWPFPPNALCVDGSCTQECSTSTCNSWKVVARLTK